MIRAVMLAVVVFFSSFASAQCVPQQGPFIGPSGHVVDPPRMWDGARGCYTWAGATSGASSSMSMPTFQAPPQQQGVVHVNGQPMVWVRLPNGQMALVAHHQQAVSFPAQQVQHHPQQVVGVAGGFSKCEVVGGIAGATVGSMAHHHRPQAVVLGTIVGGMLGNVACRPTQALPQQPTQVVGQQVSQGQGAASCDAGKRPGVLNLPGNPKHGQHVCAFPGDQNISQWL